MVYFEEKQGFSSTLEFQAKILLFGTFIKLRKIQIFFGKNVFLHRYHTPWVIQGVSQFYKVNFIEKNLFIAKKAIMTFWTSID